MRKWYKLSLSLASKCRLGFAAAVLLIIGAALILPYRWMDKLVEQGKLELAQSQVHHLLANHFAFSGSPTSTSPAPPLGLATGENHPLQTAHWATQGEILTDHWTISSAEIEPLTVTSATDAPPAQADLQEQPRMRWIRPFEPVRRITPPNTAPTDPETAEAATAEQEQKTNQLLQTLPDDPFLREGLREFLQEESKNEHFQLTHPARYLRAVWVQRNCLTSGCHTSHEVDISATEQLAAAGPPIFQEGQLVGLIDVTLPPGQTGPTLLFNRLFIIVGGFLAGICAIVVFYLITQRFILEPVRSLREAADQVTIPTPYATDPPAEQDDYWNAARSITESIQTGDEFEKLAQAFNQMLDRLKTAQDQLRATNRALDIQLDKLAEKNLALFESNKLKSEFLANVSHELRTPLNAIIGFAEILKEQLQADPKQSRYVSNVLESGKMLLSIINDLLDLAKMEAGRMEIHWDKCSVSEIIDVLINLIRPQIEEKKLRIQSSVDDNLGLVETDPGKLQQILFNLLSNAVKFTPRKGRIDIGARRTDRDTFQVTVADTGPGIPPDDHEKIFEKFLQLDGSMTREHAGAGLGLAIVKELTQMLGGHINVASQPHQGSIFTVELPCEKTQTAAPQPYHAAYE